MDCCFSFGSLRLLKLQQGSQHTVKKENTLVKNSTMNKTKSSERWTQWRRTLNDRHQNHHSPWWVRSGKTGDGDTGSLKRFLAYLLNGNHTFDTTFLVGTYTRRVRTAFKEHGFKKGQEDNRLDISFAYFAEISPTMLIGWLCGYFLHRNYKKGQVKPYPQTQASH